MRAEKSEMGRLEFVTRAAQTAALSTGFASRGATEDQSIGRADTTTPRFLGRTQVRLPTLGYGPLGRRNVLVSFCCGKFRSRFRPFAIA
jgi:hypothetical protein